MKQAILAATLVSMAIACGPEADGRRSTDGAISAGPATAPNPAVPYHVAVSIPGGEGPFVILDVDGDGHEDLVFSGDTPRIARWTAGTHVSLDALATLIGICADDGRIEGQTLVLTGPDGGSVRLPMRNHALCGPRDVVGDGSTNWIVADFDGDGLADILDWDGSRLRRGRVGGGFGEPVDLPWDDSGPATAKCWPFAVRQVDGLPGMDLVGTCGVTSFRNGKRHHEGGVEIPGVPALFAAAADLDGDGLPEVVVSSGKRVYARRLDGTPMGTDPAFEYDTVHILDDSTVSAVDVDGDGRDEVFFRQGAGLVALHAAPDGKLVSMGELILDGGYFTGALMRALAMLPMDDIPGDDLLVDRGGDLVWFDPAGLTGPSSRLMPSGAFGYLDVRAAGIVDIDADGKPDIALLNEGTIRTRLAADHYAEAPVRTRLSGMRDILPSFPPYFAAADFDGDGERDLSLGAYLMPAKGGRIVDFGSTSLAFPESDPAKPHGWVADTDSDGKPDTPLGRGALAVPELGEHNVHPVVDVESCVHQFVAPMISGLDPVLVDWNEHGVTLRLFQKAIGRCDELGTAPYGGILKAATQGRDGRVWFVAQRNLPGPDFGEAVALGLTFTVSEDARTGDPILHHEWKELASAPCPPTGIAIAAEAPFLLGISCYFPSQGPQQGQIWGKPDVSGVGGFITLAADGAGTALLASPNATTIQSIGRIDFDRDGKQDLFIAAGKTEWWRGR